MRDQAAQLHAQAVARLQHGDLESAHKLLIQAVKLDPTAVDSQYQLGNCLRRLHRFVEAEQAFRTVVQLEPGRVAAWFGLSFLYTETGRQQDALINLREIVNNFDDLKTWHQAGGLMADLGFYKDAIELYEKILEREPQARNYLRLGQYYQKVGRYADAERAFLAAIERNPDSGAAYLLLANTRRFTDSAEDTARIQQFDAFLQRATMPDTRACLHFALGKILDDREEFDAAFPHFAEGNRLRKLEHGFNAEEWLGFARVLQGRSDKFVDRTPVPEAKGPAPLFIVGMLRSGTTLVERILASHPDVKGLGEVNWMAELAGHAVSRTGAEYPAFVDRLTEPQLAEMRDAYMRRWPEHLGGARYLVDKNPLNFMYLGLVARLFPEARIVHCRRDARDTCLSVYFQNFANAANSYAYDLRDIACFHNGYRMIMDHWRACLPPQMLHEVTYEQLVEQQEAETRRLLKAMSLPWDQACLDFQQLPDNISTASVWQARQPMYAQSVGRWRHYERHLSPLLDTLGKN